MINLINAVESPTQMAEKFLKVMNSYHPAYPVKIVEDRDIDVFPSQIREYANKAVHAMLVPSKNVITLTLAMSWKDNQPNDLHIFQIFYNGG